MADALTPPPPSPPDVAMIVGDTEDGKGKRILRMNEEGVAVGEVRPIVEGKSLTGDVVEMKSREGAPPNVFDVRVVHSHKPTAPPKTDVAVLKGPAKVNSDTFRANWDSTFKTLN